MKKLLIFKALFIFFLTIDTSLAKDDRPIWVAILRADGILVPFSLYEDNKWTTPWSPLHEESEYQLKWLGDTPNSWLGKSRAVPRKWYLASSKGNESEIMVSKPVRYSTHCEQNWGLLSNYAPKHAKYSPYPKIGVTLNMRNIVTPMIKTSQEAPEKNDLLSFISSEFIKLEREAVSKHAIEEGVSNNRLKYTGHPTSDAERNGMNVTLMNLYRSNSMIRNQLIYYFEVKREYGEPSTFNDSGCPAISFFKGFLKKEKGKLTFLDKDLVITDCDWQQATTILPFGIINVDKKNLIVVQKNYYESEAYQLLELGSTNLRKVVTLYGGGC